MAAAVFQTALDELRSSNADTIRVSEMGEIAYSHFVGRYGNDGHMGSKFF